MNKISVGVVGAGRMGQRHCRVYSSLRHVNFVGVCDLNAEAGQRVAATYETRYFADFDELLAQVDAVTIATTTPAHYPLAKRAIEHGVHVLVEKPIAETIEQGQALVALAARHDVVLQVGHIERFNPTVLELRKLLANKHIISVNMQRLSSFDASNTDVDVIYDLMIHDLDLMASLLGHDFETTQAWGRSLSTNTVDHAVAVFSYRNGPIATLCASRITEQKVRAIEVIADGAYIEADLLGKRLVVHQHTFPRYVDSDDVNAYRQESLIERIHVPMNEPLALELSHFISCVSEGRSSDVPGEDGVRALELADLLHVQLAPSRPAVNGHLSAVAA